MADRDEAEAASTAGRLLLATPAPVSFALGKRDVIGAWLVCFGFAAACFSLLVVAAPDRVGSPAALIKPGVIGTVAATEAYRQGRC
jgi:hypothetical protein